MNLVVASAGAVFLLAALAVVSSSPCCFQSVGASLGVTNRRHGHVPWLSTRHRRHRHGEREATRTRYLLGFLLALPPSSRQESSSCCESSPPSSVVTRLFLDQQFNRWRLLQQLLEAEVEGGDVNEVLYRVLKSFLDIPRPKRIVDSEGIARSNTSPIIGAEIRAIIQSLVDSESSHKTISIFTSDCSVQSMEILADVEKLLPDPIEDEDAHKTCWDLVMEMYGKEAVKAEEVERSTDWRARCSVARVLIHFDFLDAGFIESGL